MDGDGIGKIEENLWEALALLEAAFPKTTGDSMRLHAAYLPMIARVLGPLHGWTFYLFERVQGRMIRLARNRRHPEASIAKHFVRREGAALVKRAVVDGADEDELSEDDRDDSDIGIGMDDEEVAADDVRVDVDGPSADHFNIDEHSRVADDVGPAAGHLIGPSRSYAAWLKPYTQAFSIAPDVTLFGPGSWRKAELAKSIRNLTFDRKCLVGRMFTKEEELCSSLGIRQHLELWVMQKLLNVYVTKYFPDSRAHVFRGDKPVGKHRGALNVLAILKRSVHGA